MYVDIDGHPDAWWAVRYDGDGYVDTDRYDDIQALWECNSRSVEAVLLDSPIGLRELSRRRRGCDATARDRLVPPRAASVFPAPVRAAVHQDSYAAARTARRR